MNLPRSARSRPWGIVVALVLAPTLAQAQSDQGTLIIRSGEREIGTEEFKLTRGSEGVRLTSKVSYPGRPALSLAASLDRAPSGDFAFQLDRRVAGGGGQVYAVQKRNRLTIRRVERGAEQASEVPGGPSLVVLADSVFSLYLQLAVLGGEPEGTFTAVYPAGPRRVAVTVQRAPCGECGTLLRVSGDVAAEIELGDQGEVLRISLPTLGLEALRKQP